MVVKLQIRRHYVLFQQMVLYVTRTELHLPLFLALLLLILDRMQNQRQRIHLLKWKNVMSN